MAEGFRGLDPSILSLSRARHGFLQADLRISPSMDPMDPAFEPENLRVGSASIIRS